MATNQYGYTPQVYANYEEFCETDQELKLIKLLAAGNSQKKAAGILGINRGVVSRIFKKIGTRSKVAGNLMGDFDAPVKDPLVIDGISAFYNLQTGDMTRAWVKTKVDKNRQIELLKESFEATLQNYDPLKKIKMPKRCSKDTMPVIPIGDPHIGMYAWKQETGEDFDCDIAERDLRAAMAYQIERTPPSETCLILNLGDFFHADNQNNRTAKAGNALDVDGRWSRVLQIGLTLMIDCIEMALHKHKNVIVKNNIGNHDDHTSQVLSICLMHTFKNNKRVQVANPADPFFALEFGANAVFSTHSHMVKPKQMQGVISNFYPEIWGRTTHRVAFLGHWHHEQRFEENGLMVEIFNTLASSDAWHHASGYRSNRNLKTIILDRHEGEVERFTYCLPRAILQSYATV